MALKKHPNKFCKCGNLKNYKAKLCVECYNKQRDYGNQPIQKVKVNAPNWTRYRAPIAKHARKVYIASGLPMTCLVCGYDKFTDICHIKPVSEFPDGTLIGIVNHILNLIPLCPNHHREFDNEMIDIKLILNKQKFMREQALMG